MSSPIRARNAVATTFVLAGFMLASWLSRIPEVRDHLELTPGQLGRVLLAFALGSVVALPTAGLVVNRFGAGRAVALGVAPSGAGLVLVGFVGGHLALPAAVAAGLVVIGYGTGLWDVAMNVEGAAVERRLGRSIMPRLHAGFSIGTVAGAGLGAGAVAVQLPVAVHLGAAGVIVSVVGLVATRSFLPADARAADGAAADQPRPSLWQAWREPRTLLIGVLVLAFALGEGIAYDWLAIGLVDGLGVSNAAGAGGLAVFVTAMTVARTFGTLAIDRFGRVRVLRSSAALAAAGVLLVVLGGSFPLALIGAVAWGLGIALGFPVGMSAGADDPQRAAIRVSVVASIAYTAFLAGPPLLGWIGDHAGVQRALLVAAAAMGVGALAAGATRRLHPQAPPGRVYCGQCAVRSRHAELVVTLRYPAAMANPPHYGSPQGGYAVPPNAPPLPPGYHGPYGYPPHPPPPTAPNGQPLADFGQRLLAYLLDALIVTGVAMVFAIPVYIWWFVTFFNRMEQLSQPGTTPPDASALFAEVLLPMFGMVALVVVLSMGITYIYHVEMMFRSGQTVGKRVMKLRVVPLDPAARLTRGDAVKRFLIEWGGGSFIPAFSYVDGLWQLWDKPYRQCLHDKWPRTAVVRVAG